MILKKIERKQVYRNCKKSSLIIRFKVKGRIELGYDLIRISEEGD